MAAVASPGQHGSYVLVTQASSPDNDDSSTYATAALAPPRPRFFALLPLLALADLATATALAVLVVRRLDGLPGDDQGQLSAVLKTKRLIGTIVLGAVARTCCLSFIGCSKRIRDRVIGVAATCLVSHLSELELNVQPDSTFSQMSILLLVSVANILFLLPPLVVPASISRLAGLPRLPHVPLPKLPKATAALLVGHQIALTLLEWATYIAVVGVRVAPRRVGAANARRWQRGVRTEAEGWQGEDESLYDADEGEAYSDELHHEQVEEEQEEQGGVVGEAGVAQHDEAEEHVSPLPTHAVPASPLLRPKSQALEAASSPQAGLPRANAAPLSPASPAPRGSAASQSRLRALSAQATPGGAPPSPSSRRSLHSPRTSLYGAVDLESQPFPAEEQSDDELDPGELI